MFSMTKPSGRTREIGRFLSDIGLPHASGFDNLYRMCEDNGGRPLRLANNTYAETDYHHASGNRTVVIRLHGKAIATIMRSNGVVMDACGYQTVTTKQRLNQIGEAFGFYVSQKDWEWTVRYNDGRTVDFSDGRMY